MPSQPLHRFSLASLDWPRESRLSEWRNVLSGMFGVGLRAEDVAAFEGDVAVARTEKFVFSTISASPLQLIRSPALIEQHAIECVAVTWLVSGGVAGLAGDMELAAKAGDIFFLDLTQSLQAFWSPQGGVTRLASLWLPRSRVVAALSDENALHGVVLRAATPSGAVLGSALRAFGEATADKIDSAEFDVLADGLVEMSVRAASRRLADGQSSPAVVPLASFVAIRRYIDRNLASAALDADLVAQTFGLSRASLYRLFEPVGGIARYIRKARLKRAYQEVVAPELANQRIGQIAYRMGFRNVSAFNRLFQDAYGVSPSAARAKALLGTAVHLRAQSAGKESLASWLAQICG